MADEENAANNEQADINADETVDSTARADTGSADDIAQAALNAAENAVDSLRNTNDGTDSDNTSSDNDVEDEVDGNDADAATAAMFAEFNAKNAGAGGEVGEGGGNDGSQPVELPEFSQLNGETGAMGIELLSQVNLNVRIELGRTKMLVEDVLKLNDGSVVELDKLAGDPVDVYVNDRHVARGEVLVLNDSFCVRISEVVSQPEVCVVDYEK